MDAIPIGALFTATIIVVLLTIEVGYRFGLAIVRRARAEKESSVSTIAAALLGLVAFMLAFTFGIVTDRYDARKSLVREEANAVGTAYLRSAFLPENDRAHAAGLFRKYLDCRLAAAMSHEAAYVENALAESSRIQGELWDMAVTNARKDMNSEIGALYIDALNKVIDVHALRVAVSWQARIPGGMWLVLAFLAILGMTGIGYQAAIAGSAKRSLATPILAVAFSLVIALIASLDRPQSNIINVSQQPLVDVRASMDEAGGHR